MPDFTANPAINTDASATKFLWRAVAAALGRAVGLADDRGIDLVRPVADGLEIEGAAAEQFVHSLRVERPATARLTSIIADTLEAWADGRPGAEDVTKAAGDIRRALDAAMAAEAARMTTPEQRRAGHRARPSALPPPAQRSYSTGPSRMGLSERRVNGAPAAWEDPAGPPAVLQVRVVKPEGLVVRGHTLPAGAVVIVKNSPATRAAIGAGLIELAIRDLRRRGTESRMVRG